MPEASNVIAVTSESAPIRSYWFLGVSGATTITGIFTNLMKQRTGLAINTTVPQGNGSADAVQIATSIPADATGAILRFSGDTAWDLNTGTSDEFEDNYARFPKFGTGSGNVPLGDVAVV